MIKNKKVAIILGYYNGSRHLTEQVESIMSQAHSNFELYIYDDHYADKVNLDLLGLSLLELQKVHLVVRKENVGFTNNFLEALSGIDSSFDFYAFSDQDDIWYDEKIEKALTELQKHSSEQSLLYCARTSVTDESCSISIGTSPDFNKKPSFANALIQNIAGGNTMVFNRTARSLIVESVEGVNVISHDWWCYQIVSGSGGFVYFDSEPCLKYRQHSENIVGIGNSWTSRFIRILDLFKGKHRKWNDTNIDALTKKRHLLTLESQRCIDDLSEARQSSLIERIKLFRKSAVYRQTFLGNVGRLIAIIINKV